MTRSIADPPPAVAEAPEAPVATSESPGRLPFGTSDAALAPTLECLREDEILAYRSGETSEAERARIHQHLDACEACNQLLHVVLANDLPSSGAVAMGTSFWAKALAPGTILAKRYRIARFVGQGGMGEVYEAIDTLLDTHVALKTVLATACDSPRAARKLFDEVRNAQRVTHPNVCRINELHEHPAAGAAPMMHFLTMEFIDGEPLANHLRHAGGVLPLPRVREIARQLLDGLRAAHAKGVVHLDFKTDNIMLRRAGEPEVVIMDFGLSRALDAQVRLRTSERLQIAGTLRFMAPEQLECRPDVGPAADVYAFGVVLYQLLTGKLPFDGTSLGSILIKQLKQKPAPPSSMLRPLSGSVDEFVLRCLSPDRRLRFADAGAALAAFDALGGWSASRARTRRRHALVGAGLLATLFAASGYWSWPTSEHAPRGPATDRRANDAVTSIAQGAELAQAPQPAPPEPAEPGSMLLRPTLAHPTPLPAEPDPPAVANRSAPAPPQAVPSAPVRRSPASPRRRPPSAAVERSAPPRSVEPTAPQSAADGVSASGAAPLERQSKIRNAPGRFLEPASSR